MPTETDDVLAEVLAEERHERDLIEAYKVSLTAHEVLCAQVEKFFMGQVREALAAHQLGLARGLVDRCPDTVTKSFMLDAIRQYKGR